MAKHNKWSKVKRLKAVTDSRKGKVFSRLARDITLAAKSGGGSPDANARLRTLLLKAREANMPVDNIDRAIRKGTGELPGVVWFSADMDIDCEFNKLLEEPVRLRARPAAECGHSAGAGSGINASASVRFTGLC